LVFPLPGRRWRIFIPALCFTSWRGCSLRARELQQPAKCSGYRLRGTAEGVSTASTADLNHLPAQLLKTLEFSHFLLHLAQRRRRDQVSALVLSPALRVRRKSGTRRKSPSATSWRNGSLRLASNSHFHVERSAGTLYSSELCATVYHG
jgi:hypothetical protein